MDLNQKTFLIITGASRGIGQMMAIQFAQKVKTGSVLMLLGRNQSNLAETKTKIIEATNGSAQVEVMMVQLDLTSATAKQFDQILSDSLSLFTGAKPTDFERAILIHNAGSVGDTSKYAREVSDTDIWTKYYHMNLFSAISLNCEFMRKFSAIPKVVINLSTKAAVEPFASMSYYSSVKAARDMYFRVLAIEEDDSNVVVLNYAPGAIDTDMSLMVQQETHNAKLAAAFKEQRDNKTMLTTTQTTLKLIEILEAHKFKSGDHVDYWD